MHHLYFLQYGRNNDMAYMAPLQDILTTTLLYRFFIYMLSNKPSISSCVALLMPLDHIPMLAYIGVIALWPPSWATKSSHLASIYWRSHLSNVSIYSLNCISILYLGRWYLIGYTLRVMGTSPCQIIWVGWYILIYLCLSYKMKKK